MSGSTYQTIMAVKLGKLFNFEETARSTSYTRPHINWFTVAAASFSTHLLEKIISIFTKKTIDVIVSRQIVEST